MKKLKVVEIFYSLQGEGANVGTPSIFIRLSNCNLNCWFCDTDWNKGTEMTVDEIRAAIDKYPAFGIIWTGGEPTLQLTNEVLEHFDDYINAIETNGTNPVPSRIDYITCSPKVTPEVLKKNFPDGVDEFRYPYGVGEQLPPDIGDLPQATNYFISPLFLGKAKERFILNPRNVNDCIEFAKNNPPWRLSLQTHKILKIR
jgi:7-carboxy-7-deazaguanine synthase